MSKNMFSQRAMHAMQEHSKYIAIVVRNAMEDFHCNHLSDKQMKELNPIIRNAIYTAIYAYEASEKSNMSKAFVVSALSLIPKYWEKPRLLDGYRE